MLDVCLLGRLVSLGLVGMLGLVLLDLRIVPLDWLFCLRCSFLLWFGLVVVVS